jgi:adenylate cyclase
VLVAGFGIALVFANTVARPLLEIADQMDRVAEFDLREPPLDRSIFREIERMERSLNGMIRSLSSFAALVPRDLVKTLVTTGEVARLEGRTKRITILFSDVAGFTSLSERLAPNDLVQKLGAYLSEMARRDRERGRDGRQVHRRRRHGVLERAAGPGGPRGRGRARGDGVPEAARRAARPPGRRGRALPTRIGLATGEVVVGNIGSADG